MTNFDCVYGIRADVPGKRESAAAIGKRFLDTLDALTRIDTIFSTWMVVDGLNEACIPLAQARARMTELTETNVDRDDRGQPRPDEGYIMVATSSSGRRTPQTITLTVSAGGTRERNIISLAVGNPMMMSDKALVSYPVFKRALLAMNAIWRLPWISAYVYKKDYFKTPLLPGMPLFPYSRFHLSWISYLAAPLAVGLELPPEIRTERTSDGGLLMIAADERLEPTNPVHLRRALIISQTMIARSGV